MRTSENFNRSPNPFNKKLRYFGNLAKVPIPVRKELKAGNSHGALVTRNRHDLSRLSEEEIQELEHKYPFFTKI